MTEWLAVILGTLGFIAALAWLALRPVWIVWATNTHPDKEDDHV